MARSLLQLMLIVGLLGAGCDREDRCADLEAQLAAAVDALPTACRRDSDCRSYQIHCGVLGATSADEVPAALTRLAQAFESEQEGASCCGFDFPAAETPLTLPTSSCFQPPTQSGEEDEEAIPPPGRCETSNPSCSETCQKLRGCGATEPSAWMSAESGCEQSCGAAVTQTPLASLRLQACLLSVECDQANACVLP